MACNFIKLKEKLPQVGSKHYFYKIEDQRIIIDQNLHNKKIDFIFDENLNLKLGKGHYKLNNKKDCLLMAGEIIINENGKIIYISNDSGHYQPNQDELECFINSFLIPQCLFNSEYKIEVREF